MAEEAKEYAGESLVAAAKEETEENTPVLDLHGKQKKNLSKNDLLSHALEFQKLHQEMELNFNNPDNLTYYVMSKQWFECWKHHVSYSAVVEKKQPPPPEHGLNHPGQFNSDIIEDNYKSYISFKADKMTPFHQILRPNLAFGKEYILIDTQTMQFFYDYFEGYVVERRAEILPDGQKQVKVNHPKLNVLLVTNELLKSVDLKRISKFDIKYLQISPKSTLNDLINYLLDTVERYIVKDPYCRFMMKPDYLRIWKLDSGYTLDQVFTYIKEICNKTNSYDYKIEMKGTFLCKDLLLKIEELALSDEDTLVVELREEGKGWTFVQEGVPGLEKCEYCSRFGVLSSSCSCKKVSYCNDDCKLKDRRFHSMRCEKALDSEDEKEEFVEKPGAKKGLVGLSNLGNTCFMNSALQCLSNTNELTTHFLTQKYLDEINETNLLGSQGKVARKYASLLKNLWYEKSDVYSPSSLKYLIGKLNSMFIGYNQHDSQEFISYLLDILHEDLNRVKNKPYVESIDSDGKNEEEISRKSWANHLKRNRSHIVDIMHGQYRSQVTCPECQRVSITYDPFSTLTLPIPGKESKSIEFFFIHHENREKPYKMSMRFNPQNHKISDLVKEAATVLKKDENTFEFVFLTYTSIKRELTRDTLTSVAKKKRKILNLFAIEKSPEVISWPAEKRLELTVYMSKNHHYYSNSYVKRAFTFARPMWFLPDMTLEEVHMRIFKYFRFMFEEYCYENDDEKKYLKEASDKDLYNKFFENKNDRPYKILIVTNSRAYSPCFFCGSSKCENCELSNNAGELLSTVMSKIRDKENDKHEFELEVYWDKLPENMDLSRMNSCVDFQKKLKENNNLSETTENVEGKENPLKKTEGKNIYDCFNFFQTPETLGEDNEWYCSKCKKHQRATKEMCVYKAPKILVIHLKRFKGGGGYSTKSKLSDLITYPIEGLDLTAYIRNKEPLEAYNITEEDLNIIKNEEKSEKMVQEPATNEEDKTPMEIEKELVDKSEKEAGEIKPENVANEEEEHKSLEKMVDEPKVLYDLYAICNHFGSLGFGHYTAYAKNSGKWYYFDDSHVTLAKEKDVITDAAYLLFYRRRDN